MPRCTVQPMFKSGASLAALPARAVLQRRAVTTLVVGQLLIGTAAGLVLPVAALLAVELSGSNAYAGWPVMALSLAGAAAAHPLAVLALTRGRRVALAGGLASPRGPRDAAGDGLGQLRGPPGWAALFGGFAVLLQTRFAATDLATPLHPGPRPQPRGLGDHPGRGRRPT